MADARVAEEDYVVLYVLGRTDMKSLTAVKAGVQLGHACNQFVKEWEDIDNMPVQSLYEEWIGQSGKGFGTVIHLDGGKIEEIKRRVLLATEYDLPSGVVTDDTYPLPDGATMHKLPVETCGFVFGRKSACVPVLNGLELMPSPESEIQRLKTQIEALKIFLPHQIIDAFTRTVETR